MTDRKIPDPGYDSKTKNNILEEATKLFAIKGFGAVSIRDIAKAAGIKESTIYYHYDNKDALLADIMARFERGYRHYFDWLKDANRKAESLDELMGNMFNKEFLEMLDPAGCFGMSLALKEQHSNESARQSVFELFYRHSVESMKTDFDRLVEKGVIPPSDTKTIATLFMSCVMTMNDMRIHEYMGTKPPVNCLEVYGDLKKFITNALMRGAKG